VRTTCKAFICYNSSQNYPEVTFSWLHLYFLLKIRLSLSQLLRKSKSERFLFRVGDFNPTPSRIVGRPVFYWWPLFHLGLQHRSAYLTCCLANQLRAAQVDRKSFLSTADPSGNRYGGDILVAHNSDPNHHLFESNISRWFSKTRAAWAILDKLHQELYRWATRGFVLKIYLQGFRII
jgi:hypothetical protein